MFASPLGVVVTLAARLLIQGSAPGEPGMQQVLTQHTHLGEPGPSRLLPWYRLLGEINQQMGNFCPSGSFFLYHSTFQINKYCKINFYFTHLGGELKQK